MLRALGQQKVKHPFTFNMQHKKQNIVTDSTR
jgi:hypothetical protein